MSAERIPGPLARRLYEEVLPQTLAAYEDTVAVIGIDGPTAAGKTILADDLAELLRRDGRPVWSYRLDWTLAEREPRLADLAHLREARVDTFPFEGELHMRLDLARGFLAQVRRFREALCADPTGPRRSQVIRLDRLYSRPDGGRAVGGAECRLEPGLVILIEGHYTARPELDELIDLNLLLLSSPQELLRRKVARVSGYRGEAEAVDYFQRIDLPSFRHHLARFGSRFDRVVDNSDYRAPRLESLAFVRAWLGDDAPSGESLHEGVSGVAARLLSPSLFVESALSSALEALLDAVVSWDRMVGEYLRQDAGGVGGDPFQQAESLLAGLERRFADHAIRFRLRHTHASPGVDARRLPLSLGVSVTAPRGEPLHLLAEVAHGALEIQVVWAGGRSRVRIEREIGAVTPPDGVRLRVSAPYHPLPVHEVPPRLLTPAPFTLPDFLHDYPLAIEAADEALSPTQGLRRLLDRGGVWVQRFSRFAELALFDELVAAGGGISVRAGHHLIALRSDDEALCRRFKAFRRNTPAADEMDCAFSASMIEVPFGPDYCRLVDRLVAEGVRHFHIDVGDGRFIPRVIDVLDKVHYLRRHHPEVRLHAHLMAEEPQAAEEGGVSLIDRYLDAGCHAVALHPRAVAREEALIAALHHIRRRGARPGLVLETDRPIDDALWTIVRQADLDWSVVMGVPVGRGGQRFDPATLERLAALQRLARADGRRFLIEIDGGLTLDVIEPCRRAGARLFAGWSIVRADGEEATLDRLRRLQQRLAEA
ncbi:hypothetical protein [Endothiovibrio diazotrophicus]